MAQTDTHSDVTPATKPTEIARELIRLLNARDLDGVSALWHDDLQEHFLVLGEPLRGKAAARAFFEELFAAFPDFDTEVEAYAGDDTKAFISWRVRATFSGGPFQGIESNGSRIDLLGVDRMEFENGLLRRNTVYYDGAGFARQIGMLPPLGSFGENAMKAGFNALTAVKKRLGR